MTTQCISYDEVLRMPDDERDWWCERCEEYQDNQREEAARAKSGH